MIQETNELGHTWNYAYNDRSQRTLETDPLGRTTRWVYDNLGNLIERVDALGHLTTYAYDRFGNRVVTIDPLGNHSRKIYDENGLHLISQTNKNGHTTHFGYDALGRRTLEIDPTGAERRFAYQLDGRRTETRDPLGYTSFTEYNATGDIIRETNELGAVTSHVFGVRRDRGGPMRQSMTDPLGYVTRFGYDAKGNRTSITDPMGNKTRFRYDGRSRPIEEIDALGHRTRVEYDAAGSVTRRTDRENHTTVFEYDAAGHLTKETDPLGHTTILVRDAVGNLIGATDAKGTRTLFAYDARNRITSEETISKDGSASQKIARVYDALGHLVRETDPSGLVTEYGYDPEGNRIETRQLGPGGTVLKRTRQIFDSRNLLIGSIDPNGHSTVFRYDAAGRLTESSDEMGLLFVRRHDATGNVVQEENGLGYTIFRRYNKRGDLVRAVDRLGSVTHYEVDGNKNQTVSTNARGHVTKKYYDPENRLIAEEDELGYATTYAYDAESRQIAFINPLGEAIRSVYDAAGRLIQSSDALDQTTSYGYDEIGQRTLIIDPNGATTLHRFDDFGRRTQTIVAMGEPEETTTRFSFDEVGHLLSIEGAGRNQVQFDYDILGRMTLETDGDGDAHQIEYDPAGRRTQETLPDGSRVDLTYDVRSNLKTLVVDGRLEQVFDYDPANRLIEAIDYNGGRGTHVVTRAYDAQGRIIAERQDRHRVRHAYDETGNRTRLVYPSGLIVRTVYDPTNRPSKITNSRTKDPAVITYNLAGRVDRMTLGNRVALDLHYDANGREVFRRYTLDENTDLYRHRSQYDSDGNRVEDTIFNAGLDSQVETKVLSQYDAQRRLTEQSYPSKRVFWRYDGVGNWIESNHGGRVETRETNADNEYTNLDYDEQGNLKAHGDLSFRYDALNRLVEVSDPSGRSVATFQYDALGRRVTRTGPEGALARWIYGGRQVIEERTREGVQTTVLGTEIDRPLYTMEGSGRVLYYLSDVQHSVRALVSPLGEVLEAYDYSSFGLRQIFDGGGQVLKTSALGNARGYTGRWHDANTDLIDYRARVYNPTLGRFHTRDPLGYVDGVNRYAYVRNNPLRFIDPTGLVSAMIPGSIRGDLNGGLGRSPGGVGSPGLGDGSGGGFDGKGFGQDALGAVGMPSADGLGMIACFSSCTAGEFGATIKDPGFGSLFADTATSIARGAARGVGNLAGKIARFAAGAANFLFGKGKGDGNGGPSSGGTSG